MTSQVEEYVRRPKQYYNIDGVGELGFGFMLLAFSLLGWLQMSTAQRSFWNQMYGAIPYMLLVVAVIHYGSKAVKKHITYPRTGYVEYRKSAKTWLPPLLLGVIVSAATPLLLLRGRVNIAALWGLLIVPIYAYRLARAVPWKWLVVVVLAIGCLVMSTAQVDIIRVLAPGSWALTKPARAALSLWLSLNFVGVVLFVSGGISFWLYLRRTQPPAQAAE